MLGNENNESFINGTKYRWAITDTNGWDLSIKELRKVKLEKLNGVNVNSSYLLHIGLKLTDEFDVSTTYFDFKNMILKFKGNRFKCEDLDFAEKIITSLCDGGQYEVFPKYIRK